MSKELETARQFLAANNVSVEILNSNIQELFDQERLRNSLTTFGALGSSKSVTEPLKRNTFLKYYSFFLIGHIRMG